MLFRQVINEDLGCASYVVGDPISGVMAIIDPQWNIAPYLEAAGSRGMHIGHIFETHTHADHVSGRGRLHEATGAVMHVSPIADADFPHEPLDDGTVVDLGTVRLQAMHLPGHRPEHTGLLLIDATRGDEPWAVLTGDSLFVGDVGRPDLAVDIEEGARDQFSSIGRLMSLPDWVEVYPGHIGGSLCGSGDISAKTSSTIGYERTHSPLLRSLDADEFTRTIIARLAVKPPDLDRVVGMNSGPLITPTAPPPALDGPEFLRRAEAGGVVIDGRSSAAFAAAHVPRSLSVPTAGSGFATRAALVAGRDDQLLLVGSDEEQARDMAERLAAVGRRAVIGVLAGGFSAYLDEGLPTGSIERVRAVDLPDRLAAEPGVLVVDVRDQSEFEDFRIPGSVNRPYWAFRDGPGDIPTGTTLAVICAAGKRAGLAASALARDGRGPIIHVDNGGVQTLQGLGVEMESGPM
jgi:glyoxylase-like metal-dependent hydrolase (beta-lactamase superfamily II)/rhodanese-related sulfurtransferase